jgi:uncharacterized protein YcbK (DUF882 family)
MKSTEQNKMAETKTAIRKLVRNYTTGRLEIRFVDSETGQVLDSLDGYTVVGAGTDQEAPSTEESTPEVASNSAGTGFSGGGSGGGGGAAYSIGDGTDAGFMDLIKSIPFIGDFFQDENQFPPRPSAPIDSTVDGTAPVTSVQRDGISDTGWAPDMGTQMAFNPEAGPGVGSRYGPASEMAALGQEFAFSNPSSGTGPGSIYGPSASWADEAQRQITSSAPIGNVGSWADVLGQSMMASAPLSLADVNQSAGNINPPVSTSQRGPGLAALDPNYASFERVRGVSTEGLTPSTADSIAALATNTPGGIDIRSGYRSPSTNARVGGAGQSSHMSGLAADISLKDLNDAERRDLVERSIMSGFNRVGAYSGNTGLHVDKNQSFVGDPRNVGGVYAMYDKSNSNISRAPSWFTQGYDADPNTPGAQSLLAPVPGMTREQALAANGVVNSNPNMVTNISLENPQNTEAQSVARDVVNKDPGSIARSIVTNAVTPAERAGLGLSVRTDAEREAMAKALAGELSPNTLRALTSSDPTERVAALDEAKNIIGVVENRAVARKTTLDSIMSPNVISAFRTENLNTTTNNYKQYKDAVNNVVNSFYSGKIGTPSVPDATHYYNADLVNPAWANYADQKKQVGYHTFASNVKMADMSANEFGLPMYDLDSYNNNTTGFGFTSPVDYSLSEGAGAGRGSYFGSPTTGGFAPATTPTNGWAGDAGASLAFGGGTPNFNSGSQPSSGGFASSGSPAAMGANSGSNYDSNQSDGVGSASGGFASSGSAAAQGANSGSNYGGSSGQPSSAAAQGANSDSNYGSTNSVGASSSYGSYGAGQSDTSGGFSGWGGWI